MKHQGRNGLFYLLRENIASRQMMYLLNVYIYFEVEIRLNSCYIASSFGAL
jgi:hypothetical protein